MSGARGVKAFRRLAGKGRWFVSTRRVASAPAIGPWRGAALLSYMTEPFFVADGSRPPRGHTHFWESWRIARTLAELGFDCDVISYHNTTFRPRRSYDVLVDVRHNLERLAPRLHDSCLKVAHLDTASLAFQAEAEQRRLADLKARRGVSLQPRRFEPPHRALEVADAATVIGNDWTLSTYAPAPVPLHKVPVTSEVTWDTFPERNWEAARRSFLWLGSGGMVHKGLDLVLEVFADRPDLRLTVCGPVAVEADFAEAYRAELYETPNIRTLDWIDVTSEEFDRVVRSCGALVYPSCSEGSSGAVACAMHAGLVPVVSRESGVDVAPAEGVVLASTSIAAIADAVSACAALPAAVFREHALAAWEAARTRHSRSAFTARYRDVIETLLDEGISS